MSAKLLVSGESNSGKTTLLATLKDAFIVSHDGKSYPFAQPHTNIPTFSSAIELTSTVTEKIKLYNEKFGTLPRTVVFDSVSKIFDSLLKACTLKHTGFKIYSELNTEIGVFTDFIQNLVNEGINVVILSHAIWDPDTAKFNLVSKADFGKRGGFLAETDNSIFIETKANKRVIHHKSTKFPARSILEGIPDFQPISEYNLQEHIEQLEKLKNSVAEFSL